MNRISRITGVLATAAVSFVLTGSVSVAEDVDDLPTYRQIDAAAEAYLHYSLGRLMEVRGLLTDALVQFRRAESLDPGHCELEVAVGRVLLSMGQLEEARSKMESAVASCPGDLEAITGIATASMMLEEPAEAARVLDEPARRPTAPEELVVLLGQALLTQGKLDEADALYRERSATDSLSPRIAFLHAQALLSGDRPDDALRELSRARRLDPANRAVRATLGRLLIARGRQQEGVEVLDGLLSEAAGLETEYIALARGYSELDQHDSAVEVIESATAGLGETPGLLGALGSLRFRAGDVEAALIAYERVLEMLPDSVQALNFLAYTLADEDLDPARALGYAERAVELAPENGFVRDTLGWAYYKLGRFEEARQEIETAIELGGAEPVIYEHLGDALHSLGLTDQALSAWSRALELEPGRESSIERVEAAGDPQPLEESP